MNIPVILLFLCCLVWATTFVLIKSITDVVDPFFLVFLRGIIATLGMFIYLIFFKRSIFKNKQSIIYGAILGGMLGGMYVVQTYALRFTTSGHAAIISSTFVVMVPIILFLQFKERIKKQGIIAILITCFGLFYFTYHPESSFNSGDIISFAATIIGTYHMIYCGRFVRKTEALSLIFYQFLFTSIFTGIIYLSTSTISMSFNNELIYSFIYLGLIGTLFCYFVSIWAQKSITAITIALIFATEPIFASTAAYFYLGEQLGQREFIGGGIIIGGVILYNLPLKKWLKRGVL